jgi:antibiotic biosynthesis monooxygenase (ABM) superfamily enzyme
VKQPDTITVSITRTVKPGCEADFEKALHDFVQRSLSLPGQLGVHVMRPAPGSGSREYDIIRKFASREALAEFRTSPEYLEWNQLAVELTEGGGRTEELNGLESWFTLPGAPLFPLPKWKMAIATFLGVFPVAMTLNLTLGPAIQSWNFILSSVAFNACVVALLTWVVMPIITRSLHNWLHSEERKRSI